jgi:hypothetical protein
MTTSRRSVELPTAETIEHQGIEATGHENSFARGPRPDGSGDTTPLDRKSLAGSGAIPDRQLDIRDR